ncbi:hypothetical protein F2Q69_00004248 [Brassica cretica]|uniref:Uncharacterized protein n=1 Tax=Brassica cretica TaxID=69181 RepID=A0A8S9NZ47_BRACR|nr:hypothetical protein F2Q69_00004248 [Brassica cretica]
MVKSCKALLDRGMCPLDVLDRVEVALVALLRQLWQLLLIWLNFGSGMVSVPTTETEHKAETKKRAIPRKAAGQSWEDPTLAEWPESKQCPSSSLP